MSTRDPLVSAISFLLLVFIHSPTLQCTMQTVERLPLGRSALLCDLGENKTSSVTKSSFAMTSYGKVAKGRSIDCQSNPAGFFHCSHCRIFLSYLIGSSGSCWSVEKEAHEGAERQRRTEEKWVHDIHDGADGDMGPNKGPWGASSGGDTCFAHPGGDCGALRAPGVTVTSAEFGIMGSSAQDDDIFTKLEKKTEIKSTSVMNIFKAVKLIEGKITDSSLMTSSNKKDWKSESQSTETGSITGNRAQLHSNQQTMRVKLCFGVISWCFQAVKTLVSHHFHQVSWPFLGCSSWIWPHRMTLNVIHSHYGNYLQDFQDGVAINSWLRCVDLIHRSYTI